MSAVEGQKRLLDALLAELRPHWRTDSALAARIERLLKRDPRRGARDRRLQRELLYAALRHLPWIEPLLDSDRPRALATIAWLAADMPATRAFRAEAAAGWPPCPAAAQARAAVLGRSPDELLPAWLRAECPAAFEPRERDALLSRAPLWLRLQAPDPAPVWADFERRGWTWELSAILPGAVRLPGEADATSTDSFRQGLFEVQDLGSQLLLESIGVEPGAAWLDACAGAGGKSLQLARLLGPEGRIDAHDIRPAALAELARRATRAGLTGKIRLIRTPAGPYDGVLVDAPCSGSGTWRRAPHLKWTTRAEDLPRFAGRQLALLSRFAALVRPGGRLAYATCSLCKSENEEVASRFLEAHPGFAAAAFAKSFQGEPHGPGLLFLPSGHDGDGFYIASFRRL